MALEPAHDGRALLDTLVRSDRPVVVGFFTGSAASRRAEPELARYCERHPGQLAFSVDVTKVGDVHRKLGVDVAPTVLVVQGGRVLQSLEGAQDADYYERALAEVDAPAAVRAARKQAGHRVVVYTTDTCPWCVRVKAYLRQNEVPFREINVARDQKAGAQMAARSGQHGVPQLDIDGTMIVGFDRARIDALLGLRGEAQQSA